MSKPAEKISSISAIILAGGRATRMGGENKALLSVDGKTIIERSLKVLEQIFDEIILITNYPEAFNHLPVQKYRDLIPGAGSLGGLYTGLKLCNGDYGFLFACDMPFLNPEVIRFMMTRIDGCDIIIPRVNGMLEPLHALYSKRCLTHIEEYIKMRDLKILNFFRDVKVLEIDSESLKEYDPELKFIVNVNSPADLRHAQKHEKI